jgi:superfamily II DNA or RNA helicase
VARELTARVGGFTLRPSQCEARARIAAAFAEFGGALLADPPGTGKTVVALAVAAREASRSTSARGPDETPALVVAPATLRDQWLRAAARARVPVRWCSLESLSRGATPSPARLVIIDEAHHARNTSTRRYGALAESCVGARVLLLSATPVVNRRADRDALLALFLGARAARLTPDEAARCIVRRREGDDARPRVRRLVPLRAAVEIPVLADALQALPAPVPAADGAAAAALVRISLAMAWSSSLAALDAALRRRVQRGLALADALEAGRWPTRAALRQWVVHDDATQLVLTGLLPADSAGDHTALGDALRSHVEAVIRMRALIRPHIAADTSARAAALRALACAHPGQRVAVFARHADTIRALWQELCRDPGVVAITGERVSAALGRWSRAELLHVLGPRAGPLRDDDPRAIRTVLATDLLAEGVELQGVRILVHADRTWTPARHEQREGRIARIGAAGTEVLVTRLLPPRGAVPLLRLSARLARKERARKAAVESAEVEAVLVARRATWRHDAAPDAVTPPATRFLAALRIADRIIHVAGRKSANGWRISTAPRALLALAGRAPVTVDAQFQTDARRSLARWVRRRETAALLTATTGTGGGVQLRRALRRRVEQAIRDTPFAQRSARARTLDGAVQQCLNAGGAGIETLLAASMRSSTTDEALADEVMRIAARLPAAHDRHSSAAPRATLVALYAFGPELPDGSADTRSDISLAV